jgi:hypothetical protein
MRSVSKQALKASAVICCCIVLLAVTAHLFHIHSSHNREHGKAEFNDCAICIFSLGITAYLLYVPPIYKVLAFGTVPLAALARSKGFALFQAGRAPPPSV